MPPLFLFSLNKNYICFKSQPMYRVKTFYEGLKQVEKEKSTVAGIASVANVIDSDNEMIMPGAFTKTLQERGVDSAQPRIKHLWQHSIKEPIAVPQVLKEKTIKLKDGTEVHGLYFESLFGKDTNSQDKLQMHADGLVTEFSIGFEVIKWEKDETEDGREFTKLTELKLWEYSSVTWGANALTEIVEVKSKSKPREEIIADLNNRQNALIKALRKAQYSDVDKEYFEIELKQIQEVFNSLIQQPVTLATETEDKSKDEDIALLIRQITNSLKNN